MVVSRLEECGGAEVCKKVCATRARMGGLGFYCAREGDGGIERMGRLRKEACAVVPKMCSLRSRDWICPPSRGRRNERCALRAHGGEDWVFTARGIRLSHRGNGALAKKLVVDGC